MKFPSQPVFYGVATVLLLSSCYAGPRRPLFGGEEDDPGVRRIPQDPETGPPHERIGPSGTATSPAQRPYKKTPADVLLARLRETNLGQDHKLIVDELLRRGPVVRATVREALEEERLLIDILEELDGRLGEPAPRVKRGREVAARWVDAKYQLALDRFVAGDLYGSMRIVDAILDLEPDTSLGSRLRRLRRRCQQRILRESVIRADIVPGTHTLTPKKPLQAKVRLKNVGQDTIVLRLTGRSGLGMISVDYEELSHTGARTRVRTQRTVKSRQAELRLSPGQAREITLELPSAHRRLQTGVVGRYRLGGWLRAQTMLVGNTAHPGFIPMFPVELIVVTGGDVRLARDPARALRDAIKKAAQGSRAQRREQARRAFVAGVLLASHDRDAAVRAMAAALERATGLLSDALCAGLARATREPLNFTRREWLLWWAGRRSRPGGENE